MNFRNTLILISTSLLLMIACLDQKYSQNPEHIFENGQLPKSLEREVNPQPQWRDVDAVENKRLKNNTLRIAVLDNGVDYRHPSISQQMNYKLQDGKIVGIGKDVLGNDNFAHPYLFDSRLFAFGAEGISSEGKIIGQLEDPLSLYEKINLYFIVQLKKAISKNPELKSSLFAKKIISDLQFSVIGARTFLKKKEELLEKHKEWVEKNQVVSAQTRNFKELTDLNLVKLLWTMNPETGFPRLSKEDDEDDQLQVFAKVKGLEEFLKALEIAYESTNKKYNLEKNLEQLTDFAFAHSLDKKRQDRKETQKKSLIFLNKRWFNTKTSYMFNDPWAQYFFATLQNMKLSDLKKLYSSSLSATEAKKIILSAFTKDLNDLKKAYKFKIENKKNSLTLRTERRYEAGLQLLDKIMKNFADELEKRPLIDILQSLQKPSLRNAENAKSYEFALGKYLSSLGTEVSHGTHVAGTIASENPNVLIDPIRVNTSQTAMTENSQKEILLSFIEGLKSWLESHPRILEMILHKYELIIDPDKEVNLQNSGDRKKVINFVTRIAKDLVFDEYADKKNQLSTLLNIDFVHQIDKAIQYIGEEKLKFVNVSLGTGSNRSLTHSSEDVKNDLDRLQDDFLNFVQFEYFKFRLAKAIKSYAPQTVFFVAAGNDGIWFDSQSKDVIPAGLSSTLLFSDRTDQAFREVSKYEYDVNDNIVVVASLGDDSTITPFTNIPILEDANLVFAHGENVLSAISLSDLKGASAVFKQKFNKYGLELKVNTDDPKDVQMLIELGLLSSKNKNDPMFLKLAELRLSVKLESLSSLVNGPVLRDFCINSKVCSAYYSGTSMATPNALGKVGDKVQREMEALSVNDGEELYNHPDFSPAAIQQLIKKTAPEMGGHTRFKHEKEITGPNKYKEIERPSYKNLCDSALRVAKVKK